MNPSAHIFLTGYRGTGKSSVAVILARHFQRPLVDLDQVIEGNAGKSIREIFDQGGEALFRDLESQALATVAEMPPAVISLGGGAILREANRVLIKQHGTCVWLDADAETIARRMEGDPSTAQRRPALTTLDELDEIRRLLEQRRDWYDQVSDVRIDTAEKPIEQVAREIITQLDGQSSPE